MEYNGRQARYDEVQYQSGPQRYGRQNSYDARGYQSPDATYPTQNGGGYPRRQNEEVYGGDQQYSQDYDPAWEQHQNQAQYAQPINPRATNGGPYQQQQQRHAPSQRHQYDERYRMEDQNVVQRGDTRPHDARRSSPQARPGTSASNKRQQKERILDRAEESPKAMAWDNPFGVFPGSKKNAEERKKKQAGEVSPQRRARTPPSTQQPQPISPPRRPMTADPNAPRTVARKSLDERRPYTSHSRPPELSPNGSASVNTYAGSYGNIPQRKQLPQAQAPSGPRGRPDQFPLPYSQKSELNLPIRSAPQDFAIRATAEPQALPQNSRNEYHQMGTQNFNQGQQRIMNSNHRHPYETATDDQRAHSQNVYDPVPTDGNSGYSSYGQPGQQGRQYSQVSDQPPMPFNNSRGRPAYRANQPTNPNAAFELPTMPNFAVMAPDATENVEREITLQAAPPYRNPTYGDGSSDYPLVRAQTRGSLGPEHATAHVQSPVDDFDFGLPKTIPPSKSIQQPAGLVFDSGNSRNGQQVPYQDSRQAQPSQPQRPPRLDSRTDMKNVPPSNGFTHPYNQPPPSRQRDQSRPRPSTEQVGRDHQFDDRNYAPRQEYGFDDQGYPQGHANNHGAYQQDNGYGQSGTHQNQEPPPLQRIRTAPVDSYQNDHAQHNHRLQQPPNTGQIGYNPRHNQYPMPQSRPQQQQYVPDHAYLEDNYSPPERPRTSNSARVPARQYPGEPLPPTQPPASSLPTSNRAHPVPIRPGLMTPSPITTPSPVSMPTPPQQVPPPPRNVQQAPEPRISAPVTVKELNELREAFKNRPNDSQLGLKFAKRLVEAAKTLANEGGKADAKQTAKNRERYINDAYKTVKKLVATGSPDAMFYLADCYGQGSLGLPVDAKEAFGLYTSAAKTGHAQSAYRVAVCCELGVQEGGGTRRDHVKAVQFYKRAATLGDPPAMYKMGMISLKGLLGQQLNPREGISWLKRAADRADADNPHALHELGLLYESAKSTDVILRDEAYALQLFTQAARLGYKYSQHRLGSAYEYGTLGCTIDARQSIHWYSEAAKQQEHQSEFALSGWYLTGSPPLLEQSDTEAYLWARKAAISGLGKAEYAMGYYTEVGIGAKPDVEEAKKWYFRAAAQGDMRARERLEELKRGATGRKRDRVSRSDVNRKNEGECVVM